MHSLWHTVKAPAPSIMDVYDRDPLGHGRVGVHGHVGGSVCRRS
ncbi:hypothetical protein [Desulforhopalus sp. 52FAK]